jgi:hypothetical protein
MDEIFYLVLGPPIGFNRGIPRVRIWHTVPVPADTAPLTGRGMNPTVNIHGVSKDRGVLLYPPFFTYLKSILLFFYVVCITYRLHFDLANAAYTSIDVTRMVARWRWGVRLVFASETEEMAVVGRGG